MSDSIKLVDADAPAVTSPITRQARRGLGPPDPAGLPITAVRPIRDAILDRVRAFVSELTASA